ncbi:unnamed protein product [Rotaria magnacalcarata]
MNCFSNQVFESPTDEMDIALYIKDFEVTDPSNMFQDVKFSDGKVFLLNSIKLTVEHIKLGVLNNDIVEPLATVDDYRIIDISNGFLDDFQNSTIPNDSMSHSLALDLFDITNPMNDEQWNDDEFEQIVNGGLGEEEPIMAESNSQLNASETQQTLAIEMNTFQSAFTDVEMFVTEQPKPDQRARYESDGPRFLPDSKKHPMTVEIRNLSSVQLADNTSIGIVLTMLTTTKNPKNQTFIHVNRLKYRTGDAIELDNGSVFVPLAKSDILKGEKTFPRLSIICKKFDNYSFDLTSFDEATIERTTEKYIMTDKDGMTKVAIAKQFSSDYDLLCYKIIFQLAVKQDDLISILHIKCETNIINEQKTAAKCVKRKISPGDILPAKKKDKVNRSVQHRYAESFNISTLPITRRSMEQNVITNNFDAIDNFDFSLTNNTNKSSLSTEEIDTRLFFDYTDEREQLYEIDVADLNMSLYPDEFFKSFLNEFNQLPRSCSPSPIIDEIAELFDGEPGILHPTETNDMPDQTQSTDEHLAMIKPSDHSLQTSRQSVEKLPAKDHLDSSIELSKSVAVTVPTPNQLKIVYQLEDTYRARYKSDYFPQNGSCRRPRYVADKEGNHYVTIQMPSGYKRDLTNEYIRVALITTSIDGRGHFYSPYKFQTNHRDSKVLDQNPIFLPAQAQKQNQSTMKLQLVLIKSKLDQLNDAQPLKQFPDTISIQNIINEEKLAPKDLINTYQLDKSHIAFTLCTKLPNGSYNVHSETTVISSIITESSSKQSAAPTNKTKTNRKPIEKIICCPHCNHSFDPANVKVTQRETKRKSNSRASRTCSKLANKKQSAKRRKTSE